MKEEGHRDIEGMLYPLSSQYIDEKVARKIDHAIKHTTIAQPYICFSSILYFLLFKKIGVQGEFFSGHSLGELTAFYAAGVIDEESLLRLAIARGRIMGAAKVHGMMANLDCNKKIAEQLIQGVGDYVAIANINSPKKTVISGTEEGVHAVMEKAKQKKIQVKELNVSHAFHSRLMEEAAGQLETTLFKDIK